MSDYWTAPGSGPGQHQGQSRRYSNTNPSLRPLKLAPSVESTLGNVPVSDSTFSAIQDDNADTHVPISTSSDQDTSIHHAASSFSSDSSAGLPTDPAIPKSTKDNVMKPVQNTPPMTPLALEISEQKAMSGTGQ